MKEEVISKGSVSEVNIDFKILFREIIKHSCQKFILIHNHPCGDSTPSKEDIYYTKLIKEKAGALDLKILDHIIFGKNNYFSFKDHSLI